MAIEVTKFRQSYQFEDRDIQNLRKIGSVVNKNANIFAEQFFARIASTPIVQLYLSEPSKQSEYKLKIAEWFRMLFIGNYDSAYFDRLEFIGDVHVRIELPIHQVTAAMNFVRRHLIALIHKEFANDEELLELIASTQKIIDMNLDVLVSAYHEGEMMVFSTFSKFKLSLVKLAKKASDLADLTLVVALMLVGPFVIGLFVYDAYLLVTGKVPMEEGILMVLGSLLVLWAVSELMEEQIRHLRGEGFAIAVFISLAMAALIRKILVASLASDKMGELLSYGVLVLALGVVYWLVVKNDVRIDVRNKGKNSA